MPRPAAKKHLSKVPRWGWVVAGLVLIAVAYVVIRKRSTSSSSTQTGPIVETVTGSTPSAGQLAFGAQPSQNAAPQDQLQPAILAELKYLDAQVGDIWSSIPDYQEKHTGTVVYPFPDSSHPVYPPLNQPVSATQPVPQTTANRG